MSLGNKVVKKNSEARERAPCRNVLELFCRSQRLGHTWWSPCSFQTLCYLKHFFGKSKIWKKNWILVVRTQTTWHSKHDSVITLYWPLQVHNNSLILCVRCLFICWYFVWRMQSGVLERWHVFRWFLFCSWERFFDSIAPFTVTGSQASRRKRFNQKPTLCLFYSKIPAGTYSQLLRASLQLTWSPCCISRVLAHAGLI